MKSFSLFCLLSTILSLRAVAEGWRMDIGGGARYAPQFAGSEDAKASFVPIVEFDYSWTSWELYAGTLRGVGAEAQLGDTGLRVSLALDMGDSRDRSEASLPSSAAEIDCPVQLNAEAAWDLGVCELGMTGEYHPIQARYREGAREDIDLRGMRFSPFVETGLPFREGRILLLGKIGASFMNDDYAEAWYGLRASGQGSHEAGSGIESAYAEATFIWLGIAPHTWLYAKYSCSRPLGAAADSPITEGDLGQAITLFVALRLKGADHARNN